MKKKRFLLMGEDFLLLRKMLRIMKLTTFLVLAATLMVSASVYSQSTRLTLQFSEISYEQLFREIEKQTEFRFAFSNSKLDSDQKIKLDVTDETLEKILDKALPEGIAYEIVDRYVVILNAFDKVSIAEIKQQQRTVSGTVTDQSGQPLPGATVVVKGTTQGTVTNANGNYLLANTPEDATLVFSFVGMSTQEVEVGTQTSIDIAMEIDAIGIEEVVAVGYGTVRKSELTSAIAKVGGEELQTRAVARIDQALQGQLAGVNVKQSGGRPGKNAIIRVRGVGSISAGNDPLYVVDGFPVDSEFFSNMSLDNVESVEVLKDAASAAIYGSRGANGVIIVTTKRGKKGQELRLDFNAYTGISNMERNIEFMDMKDHMLYFSEVRDDAFLQAGGDLNIPPLDRPPSYRYNHHWVENPETIPYYDQWDAILRKPGAIQQKYQFSASGSTNNSRYMFSAEYFDQEGIVKSSEFKRYSFSTSIDTDITKFLTVGLNLSPYYSIDNDPDSEGKGGSIHELLGAHTIYPPRFGYWGEEMDPSFIDHFGLVNNADPARVGLKVLPNIEHLKNEATRAQLQSNIYAQVTFMPGLTLKTTFGANYWNYRRDRFENQIIRRTNAPRGENWGSQAINWLNENILNFSRTLAEKHSLGGLLGFTAQKESYKSTYLRGDNFPNDLVPTLNAATQWTGNTTMSEWSLLSYLARVNYSYADKYMLMASIRTDGSSRFGRNTKWGWFPSISAGWRMDKENFMESVDWITQLKPRASWGKTGNNNIGNYSGIATLGSYSYLLGVNETVVAGLSPNSITNPDLSWELKESTNFGIDLGFIQNRINLTVDYYNDLTSDLLLNTPVPILTGFTSELQNIGQVQNKGWEFELRTQNISSGAFRWSTNMNLSLNQNEVKKLGPEDAPILAGDWWGQVNYTSVGHPVGSFYLLKQIGIYNTQEEIDATPHWPGTRTGDAIIEDYSGPDGVPDGIIDSNDRQIMGSPIPTYYFGITNQFQYRGFDLSIFLNGSGGNYIFQDLGREFDSAGGHKPHFAHWVNRWRSTDEPGDGKTPRARGTGATNQLTSRRLWKGDYVRLKNITLGYTLPRSWTDKLNVSKLRIYAQGENLYLWDHYKVGFTPEVDLSGGNALTAGRDYGVYPSIRTFLLGVNVSF
jgi:TonB-dependent starch-binding outer membrane protein SusC